jgi:hypothetical protein
MIDQSPHWSAVRSSIAGTPVPILPPFPPLIDLKNFALPSADPDFHRYLTTHRPGLMR